MRPIAGTAGNKKPGAVMGRVRSHLASMHDYFRFTVQCQMD